MLLPVLGAASMTKRVGTASPLCMHKALNPLNHCPQFVQDSQTVGIDQIRAPIIGYRYYMAAAPSNRANAIVGNIAAKYMPVRKAHPYELAPVVCDYHRLIIHKAHSLGRPPSEMNVVEQAAFINTVYFQSEVAAGAGDVLAGWVYVYIIYNGEMPQVLMKQV